MSAKVIVALLWHFMFLNVFSLEQNRNEMKLLIYLKSLNHYSTFLIKHHDSVSFFSFFFSKLDLHVYMLDRHLDSMRDIIAFYYPHLALLSDNFLSTRNFTTTLSLSQNSISARFSCSLFLFSFGSTAGA